MNTACMRHISLWAICKLRSRAKIMAELHATIAVALRPFLSEKILAKATNHHKNSSTCTKVECVYDAGGFLWYDPLKQ